MAITARQLTLATLDRQMLLERRRVDVVEALRRLVAVQAQEPASPFVALWNRVADFEADDLLRAVHEFRAVKSPLVRITLHLLAADDLALFHSAVTPILRAARLNDRRYRSAGLEPSDADDAVAGLLVFARSPRTRDEILGHLARDADAESVDRLWWALRTCAPLLRAPTDHPWGFDLVAQYVAAPRSDAVDADAGVDELIVRSLAAFGPATARDLGRFTMLPMSTLRPALARLDGRVVHLVGPDDSELFDLADAPPLPDPDLRAPPRLLGMWDNVLLAYDDRRRIVPDAHRSDVIRRNGDVLPTVLVDGTVAGVWRVTPDAIEVGGFTPFAADTLDELDREARALRRFLLVREPVTYGRYDRWWTQLPDEHRHVIGAIG